MQTADPRVLKATRLAQEMAELRLDQATVVWITQTANAVAALRRARGNKPKAAAELGISVPMLEFQVREFTLGEVVEEARKFSDMQLEMFTVSERIHSQRAVSATFHSHLWKRIG